MRRHLGKLIALLCGLALCLGTAFYRGVPPDSGAGEWLRVLSDGALIPAVLFIGLSLLVRIAGDGQFDGIKYTMSNLLTHIRGGEKRYATYYDYMQREKKKRTGSSLMLPGLFFLAVSIVLALLYSA